MFECQCYPADAQYPCVTLLGILKCAGVPVLHHISATVFDNIVCIRISDQYVV